MFNRINIMFNSVEYRSQQPPLIYVSILVAIFDIFDVSCHYLTAFGFGISGGTSIVQPLLIGAHIKALSHPFCRKPIWGSLFIKLVKGKLHMQPWILNIQTTWYPSGLFEHTLPGRFWSAMSVREQSSKLPRQLPTQLNNRQSFPVTIYWVLLRTTIHLSVSIVII